MEGLYFVQVSLRGFKLGTESVKLQIQLNKAYIDCLKKERSHSENQIQIEENMGRTMLTKIKIAYVTYLNLAASGDISEANRIRQFILTNGGTLFFVKKIQKLNEEDHLTRELK